MIKDEVIDLLGNIEKGERATILTEIFIEELDTMDWREIQTINLNMNSYFHIRDELKKRDLV